MTRISRLNNNFKQYVKYVDARRLKPSPENALLYRKRGYQDSDFVRTRRSIRENGVLAPLFASADWYVISGHQRREHAIATERYMVPVLFSTLRRCDHTPDRWLAILREHNCGREKSFAELVREKLIDINPDEAVRQIVDDAAKRTRARIATIDIGTKKMVRFGISPVKSGMVAAILKVLRDLEDYLPVSIRAVHYRLLVEAFFRNLKEKTPYVNDLESYKDLSRLCTKLRLAGTIPWDSLCDETRPVTEWACWRDATDFIDEKAREFLLGYARDLLYSQHQHFEIVVEKLTVESFIKPIASRYRMRVVVMRGNSGIDARYRILERFRQSGKSRLCLFCLGDCDPDGDSIVDSTLRSMRDDFGVRGVRGVRVAMTHKQADKLHLPRMLTAKKLSPNYGAFVRKYGRKDCYELEAVAPKVLQGWLDTAIRSVIDLEAFNHEVQKQTAEAPEILARRRAVLEMLGRPRLVPRRTERSI
jgi:hypothetical protein